MYAESSGEPSLTQRAQSIRTTPCTRGCCHRADRCLRRPCIAHPTASHGTQHTTRRRGHDACRAAATTPAAAATTPAAAATTPGGQATPPPQGGATVVAKLTGGATPGTYTGNGNPNCSFGFLGAGVWGVSFEPQRGRQRADRRADCPAAAAAPARGTSTPTWRHALPPVSRPTAVSNSSGPGATIDIDRQRRDRRDPRRSGQRYRDGSVDLTINCPSVTRVSDGRFSLVGGGAGGRLSISGPSSSRSDSSRTRVANSQAKPYSRRRRAAATGSR